MRVRISYTIDVSDELRRAINEYHGDPGLATREAVKEWYRLRGASMDDDLLYDMSDNADGLGYSIDHEGSGS
jgi:hypothetical protein